MKIVGGDYVGYSINFGFRGITLRRHGNVINLSSSNIVKVEIVDSDERRSGVRMAAKSYVFSKVGLGGIWGGLSAKTKTVLLVGLELDSGRTILIQTNQAGYRRILKCVY